jgi:hypothetical protein
MNTAHYKELFSFNNMRVEPENGSELDTFDEYFGSSKRIEQFVTMTKQKWFSSLYSRRHEPRKMMLRRLGC